MTVRQISISLVSGGSSRLADIGKALAALPGTNVHVRKSALTELNGSGAGLSRQHDAILFRAEGTDEQNLQAIRVLTASGPGTAKVIAVADDAMTLSDMRQLTAAGVSDVISESATPEEMRRQIEACIEPIVSVAPTVAPMRKPGKVITVTQARGGVGSTTVAVNLADRLQTRRQKLRKVEPNRVVLVDLDIQFGAVGDFLDVPACEGLYQLAMDGTDPDGMFIEQSLIVLPSGLSVLSAPIGVAPVDALKPQQIAQLIDIMRYRFDFVVVDAPRALVSWLAPLLEATDRMLLVTDSAVPSIRQARRLIDFYTEDHLNLRIEIVINHESKPLLARKHHTEASKLLDRAFLHWIPNDPRAAREALDRGVPLSTAARRSPLSKSMERLGRTMVATLQQDAATKQEAKA